MPEITEAELLGYLDETLPAAALAEIELALRGSEELRQRLAALCARRERGIHSVGSAWRRHRVGCPSRSQLGSYLLEAIDPALADYIQFHVEVAGCRLCAASLDDLRQQQADTDVGRRRQRIYKSSVGYLRKK